MKIEKMSFKSPFTFLFFAFLLLASCNSEESTSGVNTAELPKKGHMEYNGTHMEYKIEGEGIPVLVLGSIIYHPRTFSDNLRKHCQLIFINMPWYIPDYVPEDLKSITIEDIVDDVEKMRQYLNLGRVAIMGHSFHGLFALEYARKYPNNVSHVIAISTPAQKGQAGGQLENDYWAMNATDMRKMKYQHNWDVNKEEIAAMDVAEGAIATYINNSPIYYRDPDYDSKWLWEGVQMNIYMMSHVFTDLFAEYKISDGPEISAPVFLALGHYDFSAPPVLWDDQRLAVPFLEYNVFTQSGHSPQLEEAENFDAKLVAWLKK